MVSGIVVWPAFRVKWISLVVNIFLVSVETRVVVGRSVYLLSSINRHVIEYTSTQNKTLSSSREFSLCELFIM